MKPRLLQQIRVRKLETFFKRPQATCSRCHVHSSRPKHASLQSAAPASIPISHDPPSNTNSPCLAILPTSTVLRTYLITGMSSSPIMLNACFALLRRMLDSKSILMSPDRNPLLRWIFKRTFYAQFCAGENKAEVQRTVGRMKNMGYTGVILEYALEVLEQDNASAETTAREIETWKEGMIETVEVAEEGDFVGLKWSGLGREALRLLKENLPPTPAMEKVIHEVCDLAAGKGLFFLPGAEEESMNNGIDTWTLELQRRYNKNKAFMYNTYQAYLHSTPAKLAQHLAAAQQHGYIPGIKVVRGAYLSSEPKSAVCSTKEETDRMYDALAEALLKRQYSEVLKPVDGHSGEAFPKVGLMLATHNLASVQRAQALRSEQARKGEARIECAYAQLQGMADEISCELVQASKNASEQDDARVDRPRAYKCATWGTLGQCMNFLMRRAFENQDAAGRTLDTRKAMSKELWRRSKAAVGLS